MVILLIKYIKYFFNKTEVLKFNISIKYIT